MHDPMKKPKPREWTPEEALNEFKYAVDTWFACMDPIIRGRAVNYAIERENLVEFKPKLTRTPLIVSGLEPPLTTPTERSTMPPIKQKDQVCGMEPSRSEGTGGSSSD